MDDAEYFKKAGYVKASTYRFKVIQFLRNNNYAMPRKIADEIKIKPNHISKVLTELKQQDLVECINPEARKGRLYRLTHTGVETLHYMDMIV